jgi:vacuolar-type H+-ATPase subunit F/Vma7
VTGRTCLWPFRIRISETILSAGAGEKKLGQDVDRVAIIADKYLALGFRMAGVTAFPVRDAGEAATALDRILEEDKYNVIIITENLSSALKKQREALLTRERERPVIAVIPDFGGPTGDRLRELRALVTQSVGAELKFES